jgi:hypothetical protein
LTPYQVRERLSPGIKRYNATLLIKSISKTGLLTLKVMTPALGEVIAPILANTSLDVNWLKQTKLKPTELAFNVTGTKESEVLI